MCSRFKVWTLQLMRVKKQTESTMWNEHRRQLCSEAIFQREGILYDDGKTEEFSLMNEKRSNSSACSVSPFGSTSEVSEGLWKLGEGLYVNCTKKNIEHLWQIGKVKLLGYFSCRPPPTSPLKTYLSISVLVDVDWTFRSLPTSSSSRFITPLLTFGHGTYIWKFSENKWYTIRTPSRLPLLEYRNCGHT